MSSPRQFPFLATALIIAGMAGCIQFAKPWHIVGPVQVLKSKTSATTAKQELETLGTLSKSEAEVVRQLLQGGRHARRSHVASRYYLNIDSRVVGIVQGSDSTIIALDVTTGGASSVSTTGTHELLEVQDAALAARLMKAVTRVETAHRR